MSLQRTKDPNIQWLELVGGLGGEAERDNFVTKTVIKKFPIEMQSMPIDQKQTVISLCSNDP